MVSGLVYTFQIICWMGTLCYWMENRELCIFRPIKGYKSLMGENAKVQNWTWPVFFVPDLVYKFPIVFKLLKQNLISFVSFCKSLGKCIETYSHRNYSCSWIILYTGSNVNRNFLEKKMRARVNGGEIYNVNKLRNQHVNITIYDK